MSRKVLPYSTFASYTTTQAISDTQFLSQFGELIGGGATGLLEPASIGAEIVESDASVRSHQTEGDLPCLQEDHFAVPSGFLVPISTTGVPKYSTFRSTTRCMWS